MIIRGEDPRTLHAAARSGTIVRVCRGLYLNNEPEPRELLEALMEHYPGAVATGVTAGQLWFKAELTTPLHLAHDQRLSASRFFQAHRTRLLAHRTIDGVRVHVPLLAVSTIADDALALKLLEGAYSGPRGRLTVDEDLAQLKRLPARTRSLLNQAALGTDSGAERKVVRALHARGINAVCNEPIGPYLWDIVLPRQKVAVEINGYEYHSSLEAMIKDSWKANCAAVRGWLILRYMGSCVAQHLPDIVEQIANARTPNLQTRAHVPVGQWHNRLMPLYPTEWEF